VKFDLFWILQTLYLRIDPQNPANQDNGSDVDGPVEDAKNKTWSSTRVASPAANDVNNPGKPRRRG
jgi:hypothetical protein